MSPTTTPVVVAVIAAVASLAGALLVEVSRRRSAARLATETAAQQAALELVKDELAATRETATRSALAEEVMATYRNPLARSAYDLQSRLWNIHRGFTGRREPDYFLLNTLYVYAEFLGWLEIVRGEVQFLDADAAGSGREVQRRIDHVRDQLAETSEYAGMDDDLYLYRGEQRAIGELMIEDNPARTGPAQRVRGYASFVRAYEDDPAFGRWFRRLTAQVDQLRYHQPRRLVLVQHALVDLIDVLDPERVRLPGKRDKITETT